MRKRAAFRYGELPKRKYIVFAARRGIYTLRTNLVYFTSTSEEEGAGRSFGSILTFIL